MDAGPIIIQAVTPILPNDNPDSLAARVLKAEHEIYVQAVRWIAEGKLFKENDKVIVEGVESAASYYLPPPHSTV